MVIGLALALVKGVAREFFIGYGYIVSAALLGFKAKAFYSLHNDLGLLG